MNALYRKVDFIVQSLLNIASFAHERSRDARLIVYRNHINLKFLIIIIILSTSGSSLLTSLRVIVEILNALVNLFSSSYVIYHFELKLERLHKLSQGRKISFFAERSHWKKSLVPLIRILMENEQIRILQLNLL